MLKRFRRAFKSGLKQRAWALRWLPAMAAGMFVQVVWAQAGPPFNTTVPSGIMDPVSYTHLTATRTSGGSCFIR